MTEGEGHLSQPERVKLSYKDKLSSCSITRASGRKDTHDFDDIYDTSLKLGYA